MKKNYLFTLIFSLIISFSYSATYYVATAANGGSDGNSGTEASPWLTLAYAVSQASSGDTINVGPGTFSSECNIHVTQSGLRIIGHGRDETIFDGSSGNSSCGFMAIQTDATLMNMTIQNYTTTSCTGANSRYCAAGINIGGPRGTNYYSVQLNITIQNVKFYNNAGNNYGNYGGAISTVPNYGSNHSIYILQCIFLDNEAVSGWGWGGGIATSDGVNMYIQNNYFMIS